MAGGGRTRRHLRLIRVRNYSIQMIVTCRTYLASVGIEGGLGNSYRGALTVSHRTTTPQQPDLPRGSEGAEGPHTGPASPPSKQNCMVDGVFTEVILVLTNFTLQQEDEESSERPGLVPVLLDRRHLSGGGRHHITRIRSRQVCINLMYANESKERIKINHISLFLNTT